MRKLKIDINMHEMLELVSAIEYYIRPDHVLSMRKDVRMQLSAFVLIELNLKLNRKLYGATAIKSFTFTPAECLAYQIAYYADLRSSSGGTNITYRLFEAIDRRRL